MVKFTSERRIFKKRFCKTQAGARRGIASNAPPQQLIFHKKMRVHKEQKK